jgi:hypothetical protein
MLDFQQLVAQSLSEIAGAENPAQARALSNVFFPLVLCRTTEDIRVYLERMGVRLSEDKDDQHNPEDGFAEHLGEEILRQVIQGLDTAIVSVNTPPSAPSSADLPRSARQPLTLPDLSEVEMCVVTPVGQQGQPRAVPGRSSAGWSSEWIPPSAADVDRDREVGRRGEELVFQAELKRVRAMGHERPEDLVIWTSQTDPGADHDIQSVGEDGRIRWIEVKSTTGTDGRFEWSRKEFEKALREGDRYELWRVYRTATTAPIAKRFVNPAALVGAYQLILELGSLRACVENLGSEESAAKVSIGLQ